MKSASATDRPLTRAHRAAAIRAHRRRVALSAAASAVVCGQQAPNCTLTTPNCQPKTSNRFHHRNQPYSVIALTDGTGAIEERYAYSAYGEPVFVSATGTVLTDSAKDNRYTYTGREWDKTIGLYHYRARIYDVESGRFCGRDPIAYVDGMSLYMSYIQLMNLDPSGAMLSGGGFPTKTAIDMCTEGHLNIAGHEVEQVLGSIAWSCIKKFQDSLLRGKPPVVAMKELQECLQGILGGGGGNVLKPLVHRFGIEKTVKWFFCTASASIVHKRLPGVTTIYFDPCDEVSVGKCETDLNACHGCCDYRQCEWILTAILKSKPMTPIGLKRKRDQCYGECTNNLEPS